MAKNLFSEFAASDKSSWKKQVEREIKKPVNELNSYKVDQTGSIDPYYSNEEFDPESFCELTDCQRKTAGWLNTPEIVIANGKTSAENIQSAIAGGAQALMLYSENILSTEDVSHLFHNIRLTDIPVFLKTQQDPEQVFDLVAKNSGYSIKGGIANDPLAQWMRTLAEFDLTQTIGLCNKTENMKDFYPIMVESHVFHNAGATPVQELAFLTGSLAFYLDRLTDANISASQALKSIFASVSVGTEYLTEIAKLRALRLLHKRIATAYDVQDVSLFIHATTSSFYDSETLPHTNMIRATSCAMSAVVGGCDSLTVRRYDESFAAPTEFSERIARNVSSVISNESYLSHVADPAAGSYYIEMLSLQLANSAWDLFLEIESKGGIVPSFKSGFIQDEIDKSWNVKQQEMHNGKVMVGVNKYQTKSPEFPDSVDFTLESLTGLRLLENRNLAKSWHLHQQKP